MAGPGCHLATTLGRSVMTCASELACFHYLTTRGQVSISTHPWLLDCGQDAAVDFGASLRGKMGGTLKNPVRSALVLAAVAMVATSCGGDATDVLPSQSAAPDVTLAIPSDQKPSGSEPTPVVPQPQLVQTITLGNSAHAGAISPDNAILYVVDQDTNQVLFIDLASQQVVATAKTGMEPFSISISPDGGTLYVPNAGDGSLSTIPTSKPAKPKRTDLGGRPLFVAVGPTDGQVYVGNIYKRSLQVLAAPKMDLKTEIPSGGENVTVSPDGRLAYVTGGGNEIEVVDTVALRKEDSFRVGEFPTQVLISPDGAVGYARGRFKGIIAFDTETGNQLNQYLTDSDVWGMALSPDGRYIYATETAGFASQGVETIETQTMTSVNFLPTDAFGNQIVISANGSRLYLFTQFEGRVVVLDTGI